jgi:hypothetical protein
LTNDPRPVILPYMPKTKYPNAKYEQYQLTRDLEITLKKIDGHVEWVEFKSLQDNTRITVWDDELPLLVKELTSIEKNSIDKP